MRSIGNMRDCPSARQKEIPGALHVHIALQRSQTDRADGRRNCEKACWRSVRIIPTQQRILLVYQHVDARFIDPSPPNELELAIEVGAERQEQQTEADRRATGQPVRGPQMNKRKVGLAKSGVGMTEMLAGTDVPPHEQSLSHESPKDSSSQSIRSIADRVGGSNALPR